MEGSLNCWTVKPTAVAFFERAYTGVPGINGSDNNSVSLVT